MKSVLPLFLLEKYMILYLIIGFFYVFGLFAYGYMMLDEDITLGDLFGGVILTMIWPLVFLVQMCYLADEYKNIVLLKKRGDDEH